MINNSKREKVKLENSIILAYENNTVLKEQEEIMNSEWFINWIKENNQ